MMNRLVACLMVMTWAAVARGDDDLSDEDRQTLSALASEVRGVAVYGRKGRIKRLTLGESKAVDLGEGDCARFSPDGKRLAVFDDRRVFVMDADGKNRRQIFEGADWPEDGCAIEFHANGKEIIFVKKKEGLWTVRIADGKAQPMPLPGRYTGEISMSADGRRLTARWGHDLYAVDVVNRTHRKFAKGCSPGISPDGKLLMNNTGGHHEMVIRRWDEEDGYKVSGRDARPDGSWDDFHWSNHPDFIVVAGDRKREESYLVRVSDKRVRRISWEGKTRFPDLFVSGVGPLAGRGRERPAPSPPAAVEPLRVAPAAVEPLRGAPAKEEPRVAPAETPVRPWPVNEDRLVFVWEDASKPNEISTADGKRLACRAEPRDAAVFSRHMGMDLTGGAFVPEDTDGRLLEAVRARGELALEAVITPRRPDGARGRGRIISFGDDFVLRQERYELRLALRTSEPPRAGEPAELTLASLSDDRPTHLVVAYKPGLLITYVNGTEVFRTDALRGDLRGFAPAALVFGAANGRGSWSGSLEAVAVYARFIDGPEATEKWKALGGRLQGRTAPESTTVSARVVGLSRIPEPRSIEPYRRALVVARYQVLGGAPRTIQVARWAILDGRIVGSAARLKVGDQVPLRLEPLAGHPQLESERLVSDFDEAGEALYLEVTPVDASDLRPSRAATAKR